MNGIGGRKHGKVGPVFWLIKWGESSTKFEEPANIEGF